MKAYSHLNTSLRTSCFVAAFTLLCCLSLSAYVVDNFNDNSKTGWTDTLNGGSVTEASAQFTITTATAGGDLTFSTKTASNYTHFATNTLELRVDLIDATSPTSLADTNTLAVLAWVPGGGSVLTNGYSVAVGRNDFQIRKDGTVLVSLDPSLINTNWRSTNITMVLRLTTNGAGGVTINARVYKRLNTPLDNAAGNYFTELFEQTATDASGSYLGTAGNAALGVKNRVSPTGSSVNFDNLQEFDIENKIIDEFNGTQTDLINTWFILLKRPDLGDTVTESGGKVDMVSYYDNFPGGYSGCFYQGRTFQIVDGGRLEFTADLVSDDLSPATFPVLGFIPGGAAGAASIREYFVAPNVGAIYMGKQYGTFTGAQLARAGYGQGDPIGTIGTTPVRLTVIMTGEGANCRFENRLEDLTVDVNSTNRLIWEHRFVDTPAKDPGASENSGNQLPYMNIDGNLGITVFNAGAPSVMATFDHATASFTIQPNAAPQLLNVLPPSGITGEPKFLPANTVISFDAKDEANIPLPNMVVTLNGVVYTNGHPNVIVTPTSVFSATRHFVLTNALSPNVDYDGTILITDPLGATNFTKLAFDTFLTNVLQVEMEEYNFTTNYDGFGAPIAPGGAFFDNPALIAEGSTDPSFAYNGLPGLPEIDFHNNNGPHIGYDADHSFRTDDAVRTSSSADARRAYLVNAGPAGTPGGYNEEELSGIHDGNWQNYTKTFTAGYYNVFMRESVFVLPVSQVTLERVTSDPHTNNQTAVTLGTFLGPQSGAGFFRNVPLTDGGGNPIVVHLAGGVETLRVTERITGNDSDANGRLSLNYMAFVPTANPGTQRPIVSSFSPPNGSVVANYSLPTFATILNRDTSVDTNTIVLKMNGTPKPITITDNGSGANVTWSLTDTPGAAVITNTLTFSDGTVSQTNTWTYSYAFLRASNSLPFTAGTTRGFNYRMVQIDAPTARDNSLLVAEAMLSIPPTIVPDPATSVDPSNRLWSTIAQGINWIDNNATIPFPGLDGVATNYTGSVNDIADYSNIAVELLGYMQLKAGGHRFRIASDDSMQLRSGATPADPNATQLASKDGTYYTLVDFNVEADGLYPTRCIWEEEGGYAELHIYSVNPDTGAERVLNDPGGNQSDPFLVKAFYQVVTISLLSSPTVNAPIGTWTVESGAAIDTNAKTITVARSGSARFYRINTPPASTPKTIVSAVLSGPNIVLTYSP
ncbi:MAG: hypothetical protein HY298_21035 [Verrucomicrobia bacterium]|nr:hypothetical protein [Verrucomicrobiota bacterium]